MHSEAKRVACPAQTHMQNSGVTGPKSPNFYQT